MIEFHIKPSVKTILFDLDGTVTDPALGILNSLEYAVAQFGIEIEDKQRLLPLIGPPLMDTFMGYFGFSEAEAAKAIDHYRDYFKDKGLYENEPYEQIEDTLKRLKALSYRLAIATSKPTVFAQTILEHFELSSYFEHIVGSNLDNTRTNKAEIITECLRLFGDSNAAHYIMIGDREHDIKGAKKLDISAIGVLYGFGTKEELEKAGADAIVAKPEEIVGLFKN